MWRRPVSAPQLKRDPLGRTQHWSRAMRSTLQFDVVITPHGAGVPPLRALLVAGFLVLGPVVALAQQPAPTPVPRDTSSAAHLQQMMGMFNQMGPMYETMMKSMIEGTLKALAEPENVERMAVFTRRYYQALMKQGFTKDEALQIVAGVGVPAMRMGR